MIVDTHADTIQWILRGNHHDGWVHGALDPISGMVALMEEARGVAELTKRGWRPRRTLVYAAWDAEERGWALLRGLKPSERVVDVAMTRGIEVRGRLAGEANPRGVQVEAKPATHGGPLESATASVDADGRFVLRLSPGTWSLGATVKSGGSVCQRQSGGVVNRSGRPSAATTPFTSSS